MTLLIKALVKIKNEPRKEYDLQSFSEIGFQPSGKFQFECEITDLKLHLISVFKSHT